MIYVLVVSGLSQALLRESPEETKLDMEYRAKDSFGNTELTPACDKIQCGEYSCPTPFELKDDGTCCGYCWAPDHIVPLDRHQAFDSPYKTEMCDSAPSNCRAPGGAAACFVPSCRAGYAPRCTSTDCCPTCQATGAEALLQMNNNSQEEVAAAVARERESIQTHDHFARVEKQ